MSKNVAAIICAAGESSRFGSSTTLTAGGKRKKQFVDVGGRGAFLRSVELFADRDDVKQILLGIPKEDEEMVNVKWGPNLKFFNVEIFFGGAERFETVNKALELVKDNIELIAVHDAVRCCLTKEWLEKVITTAAQTGAALLACPVSATIKQAKDNTIIKTVDRTGLYEAQTPQVFEAKLLKKAYENLKKLDASKINACGEQGRTDDSQLVEALGHLVGAEPAVARKVSIVETDSSNIKITRQSDIAIAQAILKSRAKSKPKGYIGPYAEAEW